MIPRFKPYLNHKELWAPLRSQEDAVSCFEEEFAHTFEANYAIAFPYGRSALWALFKALGIEGSEVIMPAYTCVVVAHATVLSGNTPRFVDITLYDYNMDLDQVESTINEKTRVIIATHLFGYPLNTDRLNEIVQAAQNQFGQKIWVTQDCAHSFGARWKGRLVCSQGDAALYGLNISKTITSVFGGMITTNDPHLHRRLRGFVDEHFVRPGLLKHIRRFLYFLTVYPAFNEKVFGFVNWLEEETNLLDYLTKAYHLDERIHFPPDYLDKMLPLEAQIGLAQLHKYRSIIRFRQNHAYTYSDRLQGIPGWNLPPLVEGATYSHYPVLVPDKTSLLTSLRKRGFQLGQLIEYSVPHLLPYRQYAEGLSFPNSVLCSKHIINLPIYPALREDDLETIIGAIRAHEGALARAASDAGGP